MVVIDAENKVLGRVAAFAAKNAILGNKVDVINAEKAIVTGKRPSVLAHYRQRQKRGVPKKGPFLPRQPDRFVRRTIRGMIPYKKPRGAEAYKRVMCYTGVPKEFENKEVTEVPDADVSKLTTLKYVHVHEICKELGTKWQKA